MRLAVVIAIAALSACRTEETRVSGQPYSCACELAGEGEAGAITCAQSAAEAIDIARACLRDDGLAVRFCYCDEDTTTWCTPGSCTR